MLITSLNKIKYNTSFGNTKGPDNKAKKPAFISTELANQADSLIRASLDLGENNFVFEHADKDITISFQKDKSILINETNKNGGAVQKSILLKDRKIINADSDVVESYLKDIFDEVDFSLLQKRKKISMPKLHSKIEENFQKIALTYPYMKVSRPRPNNVVIDKVNPVIAQEVFEYIDKVKENLQSIKYPMTRLRIRNEFPSIMKNQRGSKAFEFKGIGPDGEDMSVNTLAYEDQKLILVKISKENQNDKFMVITPRGEVVNKHLKRLLSNRKTFETSVNPSFKTPGVEGADSEKYLKALHKELVSYNDFLTNRIKNMSEAKEKFTTSQIGSTKAYTKTIDSIYTKYCTYKTEIAKLNHSKKGQMIREKFNLESKQGQPSLIFRKAAPQKEHLFISFPVINNERCTKILLLDKNDEIKKSFLIQGEKLVKFDAKNIHRSARNDTEFHYYTQSEIDNSALADYLKIIDLKLSKINRALN